jgi:predicted AAA+ superfamily ATPase
MRYLAPEITRFFAEETKMAFIAGPRQVGKTTLAKYLLSKAGMEAFYFNWDIESHRKAIIKTLKIFGKGLHLCFQGVSIASVWTKFTNTRCGRISQGTLRCDGEDIEILITGSGRLDIYQRGGDSLLGRYHIYNLHPFTLG